MRPARPCVLCASRPALLPALEGGCGVLRGLSAKLVAVEGLPQPSRGPSCSVLGRGGRCGPGLFRSLGPLRAVWGRAGRGVLWEPRGVSLWGRGRPSQRLWGSVSAGGGC